MSRQARRIKPSTRADRKRVAELNGILGNSRKSNEEKTAALAELNRLAPYESECGSSSPVNESNESASPPAPSPVPFFAPSETDLADVQKMNLRETFAEWHRLITRPWPESGCEQLAARCDAVFWRRAVLKGETALSFSDWQFEREIERAKSKKLMDKFDQWLRQSKPRTQPDPEVSDLLHALRMDSEIIDATVPSAEKQSFPKTEPATPVSPAQAVPRTESVPQRKVDPVQAASIDLRRQAETLLNGHSWLVKLSGHSAEKRESILQNIIGELLSRGCLDAIRAAEIYERLRPKGRSQFPPYRF
jgi:hypothetical protein